MSGCAWITLCKLTSQRTTQLLVRMGNFALHRLACLGGKQRNLEWIIIQIVFDLHSNILLITSSSWINLGCAEGLVVEHTEKGTIIIVWIASSHIIRISLWAWGGKCQGTVDSWNWSISKHTHSHTRQLKDAISLKLKCWVFISPISSSSGWLERVVELQIGWFNMSTTISMATQLSRLHSTPSFILDGIDIQKT